MRRVDVLQTPVRIGLGGGRRIYEVLLIPLIMYRVLSTCNRTAKEAVRELGTHFMRSRCVARESSVRACSSMLRDCDNYHTVQFRIIVPLSDDRHVSMVNNTVA